MNILRLLSASAALSLLAACSGGGASAPAPIPATPVPLPSAAPVAPAASMNQLTSYTVYVGSTDGTNVSTEIASLATGSAGATGAFVASVPTDFLRSGVQLPMPVPGAVVTFPDGSTVVADALGNFDASASPWTIANQASLAAGQQVEVIVDGTIGAPSAAPLDTFVDADEPAGTILTASFGRSTLAASPAPSPKPVAIAKMSVLPASQGMYDKEQRSYYAVGFDASAKKIALGKQKVVWTVANCSGAAAAGTLVATAEPSQITYRAPAQGSSGTCADVLTASYTNAAVTATKAPATVVSATAKAYFAARDTAVVYSGIVIDANKKPVARAIVDFFATTASSSAGRRVTITDKNGNFSEKIPAGRTPSFLVASRVAAGTGYKYQFYNVTVTPPNAQTGLTLQETTPTARPSAGF